MSTNLLLEIYQTNSTQKLEELRKKLPIDVSVDEIKQIKLLCKQANPLWIFTGVPTHFQQELLHIIGPKRSATLLDMIFSGK
ncbi:hypothetical protein [Paenisporosarcina cavernae]|uniref:Uncharacterized protein n=1 Tax=Paenisporosarcina cavernae TaxID=2320858 RepID=A0A385YSU1_9BACL|nr:hypothetical protein [Paenisporosarcina cavernae]AYC29594.1 hypothetical protein D3873_06735 [Paenisporosarcina cavernae]